MECPAGQNTVCNEYRCGFGCDCVCPGDCNQDSVVSVSDLITAVRIALGDAPATDCSAVTCDCTPGVACNPGARIDCLVRAVGAALEGCPGAATLPRLALDVEVISFPEQHQVVIVAALAHQGGPVALYRGGCTAQCSPVYFEPINFTVVGPDGSEAMPTCSPYGPLYCAETISRLGVGESRTQTLTVDGRTWDQQLEFGDCGPCIPHDLPAGHYEVTARFRYSLTGGLSPGDYEVSATTGFDWPPRSQTPDACSDSCDGQPCGPVLCAVRGFFGSVFGEGHCQPIADAQCACEPFECDHCGDGSVNSAAEMCDFGGAPGGSGCAVNCTAETVEQADIADVVLPTSIVDVPAVPLVGKMTVAHGDARNPPPPPCVPGVIRSLRFAPIPAAENRCVCVEGRESEQFGPGNAGEIILQCPSPSDFHAQAQLAVWLLGSPCGSPGADGGADGLPCTDDDGPRSGAQVIAHVQFAGSVVP